MMTDEMQTKMIIASESHKITRLKCVTNMQITAMAIRIRLIINVEIKVLFVISIIHSP